MPAYECLKCGNRLYGWACENLPCPECGGEMKEVTNENASSTA